MKASVVLQCLAIGVFGASAAHAATVWDEASNGDLSGNGLAPTALTVAAGSNVVNGTTGDRGQGVDRDYFKFTVLPGSTVTAIKLLPNTSVSGGVSFIGVQSGPQLTVTPSGGGAEQLIAQGHYGNDQINTDLLPQIKLAATAIPLPSGTYSVWVQDTGGPADYGLDFVISGPPPAAAAPSLPNWGLIMLGTLLGSMVCIRSGRAARPPA